MQHLNSLSPKELKREFARHSAGGAARLRPAEERRLLAAARVGDPRALNELAEALAGPAYRFGRAFCRNPHDAEDVMQDVLSSLVRGVGAFRGGSSLTTWAYVVARNACSHLRRRRVHEPQVIESLEAASGEGAALPLASPGADPHRLAERAELRHAIEQAVRSLPPSQRRALILRDVEGLSAAEAARILNLKERTVKSRLHRARVAVRQALAPRFGPPAGGPAAPAISPGGERGPARPGAAGGSPRRPAARPGRKRPAGACPDTALVLSRYLEGELDGSVCARLESHVASCGSCGEICRSLRSSLALCRDWGRDRPPLSLRRAVRRAIRRALLEADGRAGRRTRQRGDGENA